MEHPSCLSFAVECGVMFKGIGVVLAGFILFVGSVYLLLSAIFGRWMGYLVLAVAFFGWMTIQSGIWLFGFWSQGPETKTNLGPRGPDSAWIVDSAGLDPGAVHAELASYPSGEFPEPDTTDPLVAADVQAAQFTVDDLRFTTTDSGEKLAVAQAHFLGGGPSTVLTLHYGGGQVWHYSLLFLVGSLVLLVVHIPLLDRAERTRREFLVGGSAPPWYGPA
jgi:hypothetical protein